METISKQILEQEWVFIWPTNFQSWWKGLTQRSPLSRSPIVTQVKTWELELFLALTLPRVQNQFINQALQDMKWVPGWRDFGLLVNENVLFFRVPFFEPILDFRVPFLVSSEFCHCELSPDLRVYFVNLFSESFCGNY